MSDSYDFTIESLGPAKIKSPVKFSTVMGDQIANYVKDDEYIVYDLNAKVGEDRPEFSKKELLEKAGPREMIYFNPAHVHAGIVTCGGLCPGLNDVIRAIVNNLWFRYGVKRISGIQYGYKGLSPRYNYPTVPLTPHDVEEIHTKGGTILGSSRGTGGTDEELVDTLLQLNINMLFVIGGDGTQRGASALADEVAKHGQKIAIIGVPKTIDNDLSFIEKSFGFETAVSIAVTAVRAAHVESRCSINGIGIVKVMGRESGFIAAHTALAMNDVNFVLIPEVDFDIDGPNGLLKHLEERILARHHAVILMAEGAGQKHVSASGETDASGNKKLGNFSDLLIEKIKAHFKEKNIEMNLRYIDPSYMIRSAPASPTDSVYCLRLGTNAVHAGMCGKTKLLISLVNNYFVHLPIKMAIGKRNFVDPEGSLWRDVLDATGQPLYMKNE